MTDKRHGKRPTTKVTGEERYIQGGTQGVFRAISKGVSDGWPAFQPSEDKGVFERVVVDEDGATTLRVALEQGPDLIKLMKMSSKELLMLYDRMGDDSDVFFCGCHLWLQSAGHPDKGAYVRLDDWAKLLGYTPLQNGRGQTGGYRPGQRRDIQEGFLRLAGMTYVASVSDPETQRGRKRGGKTEFKRKTRIVTEQVFIPENRHYLSVEQGVELADGTEAIFDSDTILDGFTFKPGDALRSYLWGAGGALCKHFVRAFHYKDGSQSPEKRLARHFAFEFRQRVRPGTNDLLFRVDDLLTIAGLPPEPELPGREKQRFESALRKLQEDGIIGRKGSPGWGYADRHDEGELMQGNRMRHGWFALWREWDVVIPVPDDLYQLYIEEPEGSVVIQQTLEFSQHEVEPAFAAPAFTPEQVKDIRTAHKLSQKAFSEALGVSQGLIGQIERKITGISENFVHKLSAWVATQAEESMSQAGD